MHLCEPVEGQGFKAFDIAPIAIQKFRKYIASVVVLSGQRWARVSADDNLEFGKWRLACEILVRVYHYVGGVIDSKQTNLVKISDFFHGLRKFKTQAAVSGFDEVA